MKKRTFKLWMLWLLTITANVQMFVMHDGIMDYFGFFPLIVLYFLYIIDSGEKNNG